MDPMLAAAAADKQHREESMIETGYVIGENEGSLKFRCSITTPTVGDGGGGGDNEQAGKRGEGAARCARETGGRSLFLVFTERGDVGMRWAR
jgi:hypothetical protein